MKVMAILIGALLAGTAYAQAQPVARPQTTEINPQAARTLNSPDMQLSVLKQQMALLQAKQSKQQEEIASLREKNSHLEYCLGRLKKEVSELEHPNTNDSLATVQTNSPYMTDSCP